MKHAVLSVDPAVDIISDANGNIRFRTPHGGFTMRDPIGLVGRVTHQCRLGATRESLVEGCSEQEERDAVAQLVDILEQRRILTAKATATLPDPLGNWVGYLGHAEIKALPDIHVAGEGLLAQAVHQELKAVGFGLNVSADCRVAATDSGDLDWLLAQNRMAILDHSPFLPVWLDREMAYWGPLHVPGATGCLECLYHRQAALSRSSFRRTDYIAASTSELAVGLAARMATIELLRWTNDAYVDSEVGMAWSLDILRTHIAAATVLRLPRCPSCGAAH